MSEREEKLALLVDRAAFLRRLIADRKDAMQMKLWDNPPTKHKSIYAEYEPLIKEAAYELVDVEKEIESLRPASLKRRLANNTRSCSA